MAPLETILRYEAFPWHYEALAGDREVDGDIGWYVDRARRCRGPLLDLACGTGRIALAVAAARVPVTGLDASEAMLRIARRKAAEARLGSRVRFLHGEMQRFQLPDRFAACSIAFASFSLLLTPAEQIACLECVRRHLIPGGRLLVDINAFDAGATLRDPPFQGWGPSAFDPDRAGWVSRRARAVRLRPGNVLEYEFVYRVDRLDGTTEEHIVPMAFHTLGPVELLMLLESQGFAVVEASTGPAGQPFRLGAPRLFAVAVRR